MTITSPLAISFLFSSNHRVRPSRKTYGSCAVTWCFLPSKKVPDWRMLFSSFIVAVTAHTSSGGNLVSKKKPLRERRFSNLSARQVTFSKRLNTFTYLTYALVYLKTF